MGCENKFKVGDRVHYDDRLTKGVGTIHLRAPENEGFDWGVAVAEHDRMRAYHKGNVRWFLARDLRPALTIEPGRHYRTRNGKVTGRVSKGDTGFEAIVDGRVRIFDKAGGAVHGDDDIVEAWVPKVGERVRYSGKIPMYSEKELVGLEGIVTDAGLHTASVKWDRDVVQGIATGGAKYLANLEPLPVAAPQPAAELKIEAGRYYKTRDGRKVGPLMTTDNNEYWPFKWPEQTMYYKADGYSCPGAANRHRDQDDLIAEWPTAQSNVGAQVDAIAEEYGPAQQQEPDTTLHIKFTSDFSEMDAAILVRKKKLKKLIKLARKAGIELREAA